MSTRGWRIALGAIALALAPVALAGYSVHSPIVEPGENEIEFNGFNAWGSNAQSGAQQAAKFEFGRGMNSFWATEFEINSEKEDGNALQPTEFEWENRFQLTPQGKYWLDTGLFAAVEYKRGGKYEIKVGPMFSKDFARFTTLLNLFASHEYGNDADAGVELEYRFQLQYRWRLAVSPILEIYGKPVGRIGDFGTPRNLIGPGIRGRFSFGGGKALRYGVVVLFGASGAAADTTLVVRLEYEFF